MLNKIYIDSLKIKLNVDVVEVFKKGYEETYDLNADLIKGFSVVSNDTGEVIDEEFKKGALGFNEKGIKTKFLLSGWTNPHTDRKYEFLNILVNTKCLKEKYFEGIKWSTIKDIYDFLIDLKVCRFSFDDFVEAVVVDIDLCFNYRLPLKEFQEQLKNLKKMFIRPEKRTDTGCIDYGLNGVGRKGVGFQCSRRETTQFKSRPFMKWYAKGLELKKDDDNILFNANYLYDIKDEKGKKFVNDDLQRLEITIKNSQHLEQCLQVFGLEKKNTLENLLDIVENQVICIEIFLMFFNRHFAQKEYKNVVVKDTSELKGKDICMFKAISHMLADGLSKHEIIFSMTEDYPTKQAKHRAKVWLSGLFQRPDLKAKKIARFTSGLEWLFGIKKHSDEEIKKAILELKNKENKKR